MIKSRQTSKSKRAWANAKPGASIRRSKKQEQTILQVCTCKPATESKYRTRPSPACHADDCKDKILEGNDKRIYISKPDSRGIHKWLPLPSSDEVRFPKTTANNIYYTHDNGGRPFRVTVSRGGKQVDIAKCIYIDWKDKSIPAKYEDARYYEHALTFKTRRVLIGEDPENAYHERPDWVKMWRGNSILAALAPNRYLYIGESVFEFPTSGKSPITMYRSPVGNNDVPYPFAVDSEYAYLMIEDVKIPIGEIDLKQKPFDAYVQYYGFDEPYETKKYTTYKLGKKIIIPRD
jgi:hypothetical protein